MLNNCPLVSVVIPVYNRKQWFIKALNSVFEQTYKNYEIIVVDDGSTEDIQSIPLLKSDKVHYFKHENHGVAFSRNYGIHMAKGKYVAFLDSDDFWNNNKLLVQVEKMEATRAVWSQHNYYYFDDNTEKIIKKINTYKYRLFPDKYIFSSFKIQTSCVVVNREVVLKNNCYFDEKKTFGEDLEFYYKLLQIDQLLCIDDYLGFFRIRGTNAGLDIKKQIEARVNYYNAHKEDIFFKNNISILDKIAYRYCCSIFNVIRKKAYKKIILKAMYSIPWMIFKLDATKLMIKTYFMALNSECYK